MEKLRVCHEPKAYVMIWAIQGENQTIQQPIQQRTSSLIHLHLHKKASYQLKLYNIPLATNKVLLTCQKNLRHLFEYI